MFTRKQPYSVNSAAYSYDCHIKGVDSHTLKHLHTFTNERSIKTANTIACVLSVLPIII